MVKVVNPAVGEFQCIAKIFGEPDPGLFQCVFVNGDGVRKESVEALGVLAHRFVASLADVVKNGVDALASGPLLLVDGAARQINQLLLSLVLVPNATDRECSGMN